MRLEGEDPLGLESIELGERREGTFSVRGVASFAFTLAAFAFGAALVYEEAGLAAALIYGIAVCVLVALWLAE